LERQFGTKDEDSMSTGPEARTGTSGSTDEAKSGYTIPSVPANSGDSGASGGYGNATLIGCTCVYADPFPVRPATDLSAVDIANEEWGFVAPAVHQLRTPLTSILSFSELLIAGNGSESDRVEWTGHIRSQALRMKASLNTFLSVSEIESGRLVLRPTSVDVEAVTNEMIRVMAAVSPDVRIQSNIAPGGRLVRADEPRFQEIIWNLVDNAVKYSAGGGIVTITSDATENQMVRIEISDSGAGIPEDHLADLFQPFRRAVGKRGAKGTGLGLYIVKALAEMHGGFVGVISEPGEGTTFSVTLPTASGDEQLSGVQYVDALPAAVDDRDVVPPARPSVAGEDTSSDHFGADGEFMRWISYELRAPLTPLLAAAELLAEPTAPQVRRALWLRRIRSLAVRMKCVTDATMTASALRSGTVIVDPRPFDIITVFASVIGQTAPLLEGHPVSINVDTDARDVIGDQQRMCDVISAFLESAARECTDESEIVLNAHRIPGSDRISACVSFMPQQPSQHIDGNIPTPSLGLRVAAQLVEL
jgi:signal transduction histidine kinase